MKPSACDPSAMNVRNWINPRIKKKECWGLLVTESSSKETDEQRTDPGSRLDCLWLTGDLGKLPSLGLGLPAGAGLKELSSYTG